jgi:hypothetical protein
MCDHAILKMLRSLFMVGKLNSSKWFGVQSNPEINNLLIDKFLNFQHHWTPQFLEVLLATKK